MGGLGDTERTYFCDQCGFHGILNDGAKVIELTEKNTGGKIRYTILCPNCAEKIYKMCFIKEDDKPLSDQGLYTILNTASYNDGKYGVADAEI